MLLDVFRAFGRRWYVLVTGLVLTAGLAYGAYVSTPPEYSARGLVLLLPSQEVVGDKGNPFLSLSGLEQPAGIVVAYFASASAQQEVKEHSPTAEFFVAIDDSTRGPVIAVSITDKTAEGALSTLDYLVERIPAELGRLQADVNVPPAAAITSMPLTVDTVAKVDRSGTVRMLIAAIAVGMLLTGVAAFMLDGFMLRRAQRRSTTSPGPIMSPGPTPGRGRTGRERTEATSTAADRDLDTKEHAAVGTARPVLARRRQNN